MGRELPVWHCKHAPYGQEEWNLLREVSEQVAEGEDLAFELAYRLLDVESAYSSLQKRKGIYGSLNDEIKKCFYKNEKDATEFALERERRKKEYGLEYDVKAEADDGLTDEVMDEEANNEN